MALIIIYVVYFINLYLKYKFPHYGLHTKTKSILGEIDILELFDFDKCNCSIDDIQNYKELSKIKLIISIILPLLILLIIIWINYIKPALFV